MPVERSQLPPLIKLLVDLAIPANSELLARFLNEPEAVMEEYGLTPGQRAIVLSGNLTKLRRALDEEWEESGLALSPDEAFAMIVIWGPWAAASRRMIVWDM